MASRRYMAATMHMRLEKIEKPRVWKLSESVQEVIIVIIAKGLLACSASDASLQIEERRCSRC